MLGKVYWISPNIPEEVVHFWENFLSFYGIFDKELSWKQFFEVSLKLFELLKSIPELSNKIFEHLQKSWTF